MPASNQPLWIAGKNKNLGYCDIPLICEILGKPWRFMRMVASGMVPNPLHPLWHSTTSRRDSHGIRQSFRRHPIYAPIRHITGLYEAPLAPRTEGRPC
jgi:hypothetical protein